MIIAIALLSTLSNPVAKDPLLAGFQNPPASAKPHTWWHWMDGNVTKEGITADLKAMKEVGIGGAQMFTVSQDIPKGPVDYMSPLWREMTVHAVKEAQRFGIELCLHNCAGWSSSGGPWVKPEFAMQVLAWSETKLNGPMTYSGTLAQPKAPHVYANVPYYKDIAVYAFQNASATKAANFLGQTGVHRQDGLLVNPTTPEGIGLARTDIILLTEKYVGGKLMWDVPPGDWTVLRLGHVPTGKNNHPAPPEGDGLEVDKLSREALDEFWKGTMATVIKDIGPLAGKVLNNALVDSYEVGSQNWTPKMLEEFKKRRGYDALRFLPALAGYTVDSPRVTERFLWDWRRNIADLYYDNYFKYFGELCRKEGMLFSTEPYGNGGFDNIQVGGTADIPMGEFWIGGATLETTKIAASTGHVYGRPIIGAESFTADEGRGKWLEEPYAAKALGDFVFCNGVNRYIFHRYAHQPWLDKFPGMTMGPWGTHLERTQTWWTEAGTWMRYIARCQYLLQKGKFVADALYYYGEDAPVDLPYGPSLKPRLPAGYDYDGCDASVVMNRLKVKNGKLVLPDGMTYSFLVLPERTTMTYKMARRIQELVSEGATVVGPKPVTTPSLREYPGFEAPLRGVADQVWGKGTPGSFKVGKGRVVIGKGLDTVLADLELPPDFSFKPASPRTKMAYIHRRVGDAEVYFVSNQNYRSINVDCSFRVSGLVPELWHGDSGVSEAAPMYRSEGKLTTVSLHLGPAESVFVVFRAGRAMPHLSSLSSGATPIAPIRMPKITIKSARYETADGRGADVKEMVSGMVRSGQFEVEATNANFGDPMVNVVKRLVIEYELDGQDFKKTVAENESLVLWEAPSSPNATKSFDLHSSAKGLEMTPWKAGVYTGKNAKGKAILLTVKEGPKSLDLSSAWDVKFPPNWGAPSAIHLSSLTSWSEHNDIGVKYFSGSAVYSKTFDVPAALIGKSKTILLELGKVKNFATVSLNGVQLEVLWKEPFSVNISKALKPGRNRLDIKITNLWPNRIIGDEQLPPDVEWSNGAPLKKWPDWLVNGEPRPKTGRYTFTTWRYWHKDSTLLESGLLGPVVIRSAQKIGIR